MKACLWIFSCIVVVLMCIGVMNARSRSNPLKKYGFHYVIDVGDDGILGTFRPSLDKNGQHITGPYISGSYLAVKYQTNREQDIPEIVVYQDYGGTETPRAVLKLNLTDAKSPEFELIECDGLDVRYWPPWEDYYEKDEKTGDYILPPRIKPWPSQPVDAGRVRILQPDGDNGANAPASKL